MELDSPALAETLARAQNGDRAALALVLEALAPAMHRFSLRMCGHTADAADTLQDALLNVATHLGDFEHRSSLSSWAFALTRSACARRRRGLKNRPADGDAALAALVDPEPTPEARAAADELGDVLGRALSSLSDEHREVVLLRDVEGLTAPEAADALGISVDALKSRLHRAREQLRLALAPYTSVAAPKSSPGGCPEVAVLLSRKLEGELRTEDCAAMEKHVSSCAACTAACEGLREVLAACSRAKSGPVPPMVRARIVAALSALDEAREPKSARAGSNA